MGCATTVLEWSISGERGKSEIVGGIDLDRQRCGQITYDSELESKIHVRDIYATKDYDVSGGWRLSGCLKQRKLNMNREF